MGRFFVILISAYAFLSFGCGANDAVLRSGKETPTPADAAAAERVETVDSEVAAMRTADFDFIFVVRRRDGGLIDADDKAALKLYTADTNRRVSSENGKAFVIGSNFAVPPANIAALYDRFAVEDYSKPGAAEAANDAANVVNRPAGNKPVNAANRSGRK
jgi:hypothetical protein